MLTDVKKILVFKAAEAEKKGRQTAGERWIRKKEF